ncbi:MAG TPA: hypothetical protein VGO07_06585 [Candidatus Saccharimonadales bacterium]|jgi:hypothetical protein|nr:hypothetical protein [Candidatus Saccharimonadales bacterium]
MALNVLEIVGNPGSLNNQDIWIHDRLVGQGHTVTYIDDSSAAPGNLTSYNLVIISNTANNAQISTKYDATAVGVFSTRGGIFPHSKFSSQAGVNGANTTTFYGLAANGDPIVGSINGVTTTFRTVTDTYIYTPSAGFGAGGVLMLAARSDLTTRVTAGRYDTGGLLSDGSTTAPSRRLMVDLMDYTALNATGLSWFDNGVAWAKSNTPPIANAGPDQTVNPNTTVTLDGTSSTDDGSVTGYAWSQISGPAVTLSSALAAQPTFTAPAAVNGTTLVFGLIVTDNQSATSSQDTVTITVRPSASAKVRIGGAWVVKPLKARTSGTWQN